MIMEIERMKEDDGIEEDCEPETILEDRISELPDGIVLHILSFLPTIVAVRMSLLSKRWRRMWTLVPTLDFCYSRDVSGFRRHGEKNNEDKMMFEFLDECLNRRYADTTITRFKFDMEFYRSSGQVDRWLWFPVKQNVKELDLRIGNRRSTYSFPRCILHLRSLTLLRLSGVALDPLSTATLPYLKVLCLWDVAMDDQILNNILSGCPSLEKLWMDHCTGLRDPQISSLILKSVVFEIGCPCPTINVEAMNLRSFEYGSSCIMGKPKCHMNLVCCQEIRNLSLHNTCLSDQSLENLIPQLPLLETLKLDNCYGLRSIKIWNQHLRNFVLALKYRFDLLEVAIDTANLVHFRFAGRLRFKISVNAPNMLDANIEVSDYERKTYDNEWYENLIKFLSEFNGCKKVHMFCSSKKALIVPEELRKVYRPPLPDLKYLEVKAGGGPTYKKLIFRESLLWIAPSLNTLLIK